MARDSKLVFKFTRDVAATSATGGMGINNLANTAGITTSAFVYAPLASSNYFFNRAGSNGLNVGGFRTTLGDAASFGAQADVSAITNDPAITGNTAAAEAYVRIVASLAGVAPTAAVPMLLQVEAASDSGTGTAGTDWIPVSAAVLISGKTAVRSVPTGTTASGTFTTTSAVVHNLSVGDIVVFTVQTTGTTIVLQKPYYVNTVPSTTTFTLSNSVNGATDTTITSHTAYTATVTPVQKHIFSLPVAPTTRPWLRVAVVTTSITAAATAASQGVWIQDATYVIGRDMSAIAS